MCRREPFLLEIQHSVQRYLDPRYWRYRSKVYVVLTWLTVPICDMRTVESSLIFSGFATVFYTHAISRNLGTIDRESNRTSLSFDLHNAADFILEHVKVDHKRGGLCAVWRRHNILKLLLWFYLYPFFQFWCSIIRLIFRKLILKYVLHGKRLWKLYEYSKKLYFFTKTVTSSRGTTFSCNSFFVSSKRN